ncbi:MAG: MBL fold metallo-hydrolase [Arcobacteraceae bacterium]|nr:MBL fold metallo-hydrolase [Arcobacteraceae bacterium]
MSIKISPMGVYQTNCYIVTINDKEIIIDPGVDAFTWVKQNVTNPIAILNTHGHFDHVWSNNEIKEYFNIPIYCPKDDVFMLEDDPFSQGTPKSKADFIIEPDETIVLEDTEIKFHHFPGHTPGCSAIQINKDLFSGDFIFKGSIGRVDFPYSDSSHMKESLNKVLQWKDNLTIYPGHGDSTNLSNEKSSLKAWINYI